MKTNMVLNLSMLVDFCLINDCGSTSYKTQVLSHANLMWAKKVGIWTNTHCYMCWLMLVNQEEVTLSRHECSLWKRKFHLPYARILVTVSKGCPQVWHYSPFAWTLVLIWHCSFEETADRIKKVTGKKRQVDRNSTAFCNSNLQKLLLKGSTFFTSFVHKELGTKKNYKQLHSEEKLGPIWDWKVIIKFA